MITSSVWSTAMMGFLVPASQRQAMKLGGEMEWL